MRVKSCYDLSWRVKVVNKMDFAEYSQASKASQTCPPRPAEASGKRLLRAPLNQDIFYTRYFVCVSLLPREVYSSHM